MSEPLYTITMDDVSQFQQDLAKTHGGNVWLRLTAQHDRKRPKWRIEAFMEYRPYAGAPLRTIYQGASYPSSYAAAFPDAVLHALMDLDSTATAHTHLERMGMQMGADEGR